MSALTLLLIGASLILVFGYFRAPVTIIKFCNLNILSFSLLFLLSPWIILYKLAPVLVLLSISMLAFFVRSRRSKYYLRQYLLYALDSLALRAPQTHGSRESSLAYGLKLIARAATFIFITSSTLISTLSEVTNGDSQIYNISRIYTSILSGKLLLESTSIPTQAFHSIGHDYLYSIDIALNNLRGLSLLNLAEVISIMIIIDQVVVQQYSGFAKNQSTQETNLARSIARILTLSSPAIFFQSTTPKNDLFVALVALISIVSLSNLLSYLSKFTRTGANFSVYHTFKLSLLILIVFLMTALSKGYGIIIVLSASALSLLFALYVAKNNSLLCSSSASNGEKAFPSLYSLPILLLLSHTALSYYHHVDRFWRAEYDEFVSLHGPSSLAELALSAPINILRIAFESFVNIPLPFRISPFEGIPLLSTSHHIALSDTYTFGAILNEDIAWPGILFSVALVLTLIFLCRVNLLKNMQSFLVASYTPEIILSSGTSLLVALSLASLLYWQPYSARFYTAPMVLMIPLLSTTLSSSNAFNPAKTLKNKLPLRIFLATLCLLLVSGMVPAIAKQTYVLFNQYKDSDYYVRKSMLATTADIKKVVSSATIGNSSEVRICSRDNYSASLYLQQILLGSINRDLTKVTFPKLLECNLNSSASTTIFFGGGSPPSLTP